MKRMLALALCLWLLGAAGLAETYVAACFGTDECASYSVLIGDDGTLLTPVETYSGIFELTPEGTETSQRLYSASSYDTGIEYSPETAEEMLYDTEFLRVGLMDGSGRMRTGFDYDFLNYANGYVLFTLPDEARSTGAMDAEGRVVVPPEYSALSPLGGGKWLAVALPETPGDGAADADADDADEESYALLCIDADGEVRELGLHSSYNYFLSNPEGVNLVWNVAEYGGQTVFLDPDGAVMFDRGFESADNFEGDYAVVEEKTGYGLIGRDGNYAIEPEYDYIQREAGKPLIARKGSALFVYDPQTLELLMTSDFAPEGDLNVTLIGSDLFGVSTDRTDWICTTDGRSWEVPEGHSIMMYGYAGDGIDRLAEEVGDWPDSAYHLIDLEGNVRSGDYRMIGGGLWQDGHARFIVGDYSLIPTPDGDSAVDWNSYRYGLIDENGEVLMPMVHDDLRMLSFDRYWAVDGDRCGMIDGSGKWLFAISNYETLMD